MHFLPRTVALRVSFLPTLIVVALATNQAWAGFILVDSRAELGGNDFIDFDPLGNDGDTLVSPLSFDSEDGLSATLFSNVFDSNGERTLTLSTLNGFQSITANGTISPNAFNQTIGQFNLNFDTPVAAVGADFEASGEFSAFFEEIRLHVVRVDDSFEIFTLAGGQVDGRPENNDPSFSGFAGVRSTEADIKQIRFQAWSSNPFGASPGTASLEINRLDLSESVATANPVPEPSSLALVGVCLLSCAVFGALRHSRDSI